MQSIQIHTLAAHEMLRLPERGPIRLRVHSGRVWITQADCLNDWFVDAHQPLTLSGRRIVIEAETACEVEIAPLRTATPWWPWRQPRLLRTPAAHACCARLLRT